MNIIINVGGLWRTRVSLEDATDAGFRRLVSSKTGIPPHCCVFPEDMLGGLLGRLLESKINALVDDEEVWIEWDIPSGEHPLHSPYCGVDAIRSWAASGAEVDVLNKDGDTPLMFAVSRLMVPEVAELLSLGAQVNATNRHDETALHYLTFSPTFTDWQEAPAREIARLLVRAGADPEKRYPASFVDAVLTDIGALVAAAPPSPRSRP